MEKKLRFLYEIWFNMSTITFLMMEQTIPDWLSPEAKRDQMVRENQLDNPKDLMDHLFQRALLAQKCENDPELDRRVKASRSLLNLALLSPIEVIPNGGPTESVAGDMAITCEASGEEPTHIHITISCVSGADLTGVPVCLITEDGQGCGHEYLDNRGTALVPVTDAYTSGTINVAFRPYVAPTSAGYEAGRKSTASSFLSPPGLEVF